MGYNCKNVLDDKGVEKLTLADRGGGRPPACLEDSNPNGRGEGGVAESKCAESGLFVVFAF